jgi:rubrerythrin
MVAEVFAGLNAIKTAFDLAKGLKDIDDATRRNAVIIELQEQILSARDAQSMCLERVNELKKEMARFETWEREKQNYELKDLGWGAFAYMLKPGMRGPEPPHWVCTNCYEHNHKATLQNIFVKETGQIWTCPSCKSTIHPSTRTPAWMD